MGIFAVCVWKMCDFRSQHFDGSVLMFVMTHTSLNRSHSVGVLVSLSSNSSDVAGVGAQVQVKVLSRQSQSGEADVFCAMEEVILLSKARLWRYSTLAQMAAMSHVTRRPPFLLVSPHQLALLSDSFSCEWIGVWMLDGRGSGPLFLSNGDSPVEGRKKIFYCWSFFSSVSLYDLFTELQAFAAIRS